MIERFGSGGPWEDTVGYCRVVKAGGWALVAGCTATVDGVVVHPDDAGAQAEVAFGIALDALAAAGVPAHAVVRTRMYIMDRADADAVTAAHARRFVPIRPVASLFIVGGFLHPDHRFEVEMDAYTGEGLA